MRKCSVKNEEVNGWQVAGGKVGEKIAVSHVRTSASPRSRDSRTSSKDLSRERANVCRSRASSRSLRSGPSIEKGEKKR